MTQTKQPEQRAAMPVHGFTYDGSDALRVRNTAETRTLDEFLRAGEWELQPGSNGIVESYQAGQSYLLVAHAGDDDFCFYAPTEKAYEELSRLYANRVPMLRKLLLTPTKPVPSDIRTTPIKKWMLGLPGDGNDWKRMEF